MFSTDIIQDRPIISSHIFNEANDEEDPSNPISKDIKEGDICSPAYCVIYKKLL